MGEQRVTEADIRAVLAGTFRAESIEIWWNTPNKNLAMLPPRFMFNAGNEHLVLAEAERVAGAM